MGKGAVTSLEGFKQLDHLMGLLDWLFSDFQCPLTSPWSLSDLSTYSNLSHWKTDIEGYIENEDGISQHAKGCFKEKSIVASHCRRDRKPVLPKYKAS